jgi:AraC-like DNA-binding protein
METHIEVWRPGGLEDVVLYRGARVTHPYPRHWHEELHLCAYSAGTGLMRVRGAVQRVGPGDFVVTPPGEVHENWVDTASGCDFRSAYVGGAALRRCASILGVRASAPLSFRDLFLRDPDTHQAFLDFHSAAQSAEATLRRDEAFAELCRVLVTRNAEARVPSVRLGRERLAVRRMKDFIDAHYMDPIPLESLARIAGLSPFHVHRAFRRETGLPPHAYQTQVRVNRAKALLHGRAALSEIAATIGFADQSHLSRHFRRLVGVTPGRFGARTSKTSRANV